MLHLPAWSGAQKWYHTLGIDTSQQAKIKPLIEEFQKHYEGRSNITVVRYEFKSFNQSTKNIDTYIHELKTRFEYCEYSDPEESLLCDCIVCGIINILLHDHLLQTPNLQLAQCIKMCRLSEQQMAQLINTNVSHKEQVDAISTYRQQKMMPEKQTNNWTHHRQINRTGSSWFNCNRCGYTQGRGQYPTNGKESTGCKKIGHFIQMCKTNKQAQHQSIGGTNTICQMMRRTQSRMNMKNPTCSWEQKQTARKTNHRICGSWTLASVISEVKWTYDVF